MSSWNIQALRAQERKHIPQVLTKEEVKKVIDNLLQERINSLYTLCTVADYA